MGEPAFTLRLKLKRGSQNPAAVSHLHVCGHQVNWPSQKILVGLRLSSEVDWLSRSALNMEFDGSIHPMSLASVWKELCHCWRSSFCAWPSEEKSQFSLPLQRAAGHDEMEITCLYALRLSEPCITERCVDLTSTRGVLGIYALTGQ